MPIEKAVEDGEVIDEISHGDEFVNIHSPTQAGETTIEAIGDRAYEALHRALVSQSPSDAQWQSRCQSRPIGKGRAAISDAKLVFEETAEHGIFDDDLLSKFDVIIMLAGPATVSPTPFQEMLHERLPYTKAESMDPSSKSGQEMTDACLRYWSIRLPNQFHNPSWLKSMSHY
jgi:hypothetical protein